MQFQFNAALFVSESGLQGNMKISINAILPVVINCIIGKYNRIQHCSTVANDNIFLVKKMMMAESPTINGDGENSRDFTYIENVILMNKLAMTTENPEAFNQIYNTAYGERATLNQLVSYLKEFLSKFDPKIQNLEVIHGPDRQGDIPHSLANVDKARNLLGYEPKYSMRDGLKEAVKWYWENL